MRAGGAAMAIAVVLALPTGAVAYDVAPHSKGNVVHLEVFDPEGGSLARAVTAVIVEHPDWVERPAVTAEEGSFSRTSVAFDVDSLVEPGASGELLLRLTALDGEGLATVSVDHRVRLDVRAEVAPEQRSFLIDECCLISTGLEEAASGLPPRHVLLGSSPNPFNPLTRIRFGLPEGGGSVSMHVYDVAGRTVRTIVTPELSAGYHQISWNGTSDSGRPVPSGVYFCELVSGGWSATQKVLLVR